MFNYIDNKNDFGIILAFVYVNILENFKLFL